jgi:hypothetical protein
MIGALCGLGLIVLIALATTGGDGRTSASASSPRPSASVATHDPSPVDTGSSAPEQTLPQEAAGAVLDAVQAGVETGEISHDFAKEIDHTIDEMVRETEKGEDTDKSVEKLDDLREKVSEALEKGEITSPARASAIVDALLGFEQVFRNVEE